MVSGAFGIFLLWTVLVVNLFACVQKSKTNDDASLLCILWFFGIFWTAGCTFYILDPRGGPIELPALMPYIIGSILTATLYDLKKAVAFIGKLTP